MKKTDIDTIIEGAALGLMWTRRLSPSEPS